MPNRRIKKKKRDLKNYFILTILVIIIFLAFLAIFREKHYSFDEVIKKINEIDSKHNISFSDYKKGLFYLRYNPRYPNPFNIDEMKDVLNEYSKIKGDRATNLFVDFRKNLLEAELYYKLSYKDIRADIQNYPLRCRNEDYIMESLMNQNESIKKIKSMLENLAELKEVFPSEFLKLNISDEWIKLMNGTTIDFEGDMTFKLESFNRFCGNKTNTTSI